MGFDVNTLVAYRDEHALELKGKILWAGDSLKLFQKVPNVTRTAVINYFDVNPVLTQGTFCQSMNASGSTPILQKDITVCDMKAEDSWCENTLQNYYFTTQLKGVAGNTLGHWEKDFLNQLTKKILQANEIGAWQSFPTGCLGIFDQLSGDTSRISVTGATLSSTTIIAQIQAMINAMLSNAINISQNDDLYLFVSPSVFAMFMQAMFGNNNFGIPLINYDKNGDTVINFFGPKITLHSTYGLTGTQQMYLTTLSNLYHAFDGVSDDEKVSLWYEQKDDILYYRSKYRIGVTYWLGEYMIVNF